MSTEKFESWGIVELFGHQTIAGRISEATVGGCSFVRVDVPSVDGDFAEVGKEWKYTRYFGQGAIYALNPTSEDVARLKARTFQTPPFAYDVNHQAVERAVDERVRRLTNKSTADLEREQRDRVYGGQDETDDETPI